MRICEKKAHYQFTQWKLKKKLKMKLKKLNKKARIKTQNKNQLCLLKWIVIIKKSFVWKLMNYFLVFEKNFFFFSDKVHTITLNKNQMISCINYTSASPRLLFVFVHPRNRFTQSFEVCLWGLFLSFVFVFSTKQNKTKQHL